jgi:hypothetical protein
MSTQHAERTQKVGQNGLRMDLTEGIEITQNGLRTRCTTLRTDSEWAYNTQNELRNSLNPPEGTRTGLNSLRSNSE